MNNNLEFNQIELFTQENMMKLYNETNGNLAMLVSSPKEYILEKRMDYINSFSDVVLNNKNLQKGQYYLKVEGYDNDPRELYMIPEVVAYFKAFLSYKPSIFVYVCEDSQTLMLLMIASKLVDYSNSSKENKRVALDKLVTKEFLATVLKDLMKNNEIGVKTFNTPEIDEFLNKMFKKTGIPPFEIYAELLN